MPSRIRQGDQADQEESWDSLHYSDASNGASRESLSGEDIEDANTNEQDLPALITIGDVQNALHPLQATADRVGKQVEQFAETLDRLSTKGPQRSAKDCRHVLPLVYEYEKIANDTVKRLKKYHEPERQEKLKRSLRRRLRRSSGRSTPIDIHEDGIEDENFRTTVEDLQRWEQERQTWQLLGQMLQTEYPLQQSDSQDVKQDARSIRPMKDILLHRYSPELAVWHQFLAENDMAWERHVVVEWLKGCADSSGQDIEVVVAQLEAGADRGSGLWAHGWLYTKEAIKGHKRLRVWAQPLDPDSPAIGNSLVAADRSTTLVTQLDPDAFTRQGRSLEKEDVSFERATWLACWEMVRRGHSWNSIREWCQERVEGWRAISIRGDPRETQSEGTFNEITSSNLPHSRSLWRHMCSKAAKSGGIDEYENAVYGVLSGDLQSVLKVARNWDDYLFAYYNSYLISAFDGYLQTRFTNRHPGLPKDIRARSEICAVEESSSTNVEIIDRLHHIQLIDKEARQPIKMLQGSLISKCFHVFIYSYGIKLARFFNQHERSKIIDSPPVTHEHDSQSIYQTIDISFIDHDLLRILAHMIFIFQDIGAETTGVYALENTIVAYIDYLGKAGKQQLLPLYASRLSPGRSVECMARQLPFIIDNDERQAVMKLMKQYKMDVVGILHVHLLQIIMDTPPEKKNTAAIPKLEILDQEHTDPRQMRRIRRKFIGDEYSGDDQDLLQGLAWYMLLKGHWEQTMRAGVMLYKHFLRIRSLGAARTLSKTFTFSRISLDKTLVILGQTVDLAEEPMTDDESEVRDSFRQPTRSYGAPLKTRGEVPSRRRSNTARDLLLSHAHTFRDFEYLMVALDALEAWREIEVQIENQKDVRHSRAWKSELQRAFDAVVSAVEPLLHGWLQTPEDDREADELIEIRTACLPEVLLAYLAVINFAGHSLSREVLLMSMDLATVIAANDSDLAECFMAAHRMAELMDGLAVASKTIMHAEEVGTQTGKPPRKMKGKTLALWTVKGPT